MPYEIESNNVRVHRSTNMDSVEIKGLEYLSPDAHGGLSIVMTAESGHVQGAVPILDVLKYVLLHHPALVDTAKAQLEELAEEQHAVEQATAQAREAASEAFCDAFLEAFPSRRESSYLACDRSDTWMKVIDGAPTTGEGCIVNGLPIYDHYSQNYDLYELGILKTVAEWAKNQGMYGEPYDAGTLKFYRI